MSPFGVLLLTLALTLKVVTVQSSVGEKSEPIFELSGSDLTKLFNSVLVKAEWMIRPMWDFEEIHGIISHSGVRVTLKDGSQWLIHKGKNFGDPCSVVVVSASYMSNRWRIIEREHFSGQTTVADFVKAGGQKYDLVRANCHHAAYDMMKLGREQEREP